METKYSTVKISGIITSIGYSRKVKGGTYTENVFYCNLPEDNISDNEAKKWIAKNNKMMSAICDLLNEKF